jgi:hypothetical protein
VKMRSVTRTGRSRGLPVDCRACWNRLHGGEDQQRQDHSQGPEEPVSTVCDRGAQCQAQAQGKQGPPDCSEEAEVGCDDDTTGTGYHGEGLAAAMAPRLGRATGEQ